MDAMSLLKSGFAGSKLKLCDPFVPSDVASVSVLVTVPLKLTLAEPASADSGRKKVTGTGLFIATPAPGTISVGVCVRVSMRTLELITLAAAFPSES